MKKLQKRKGFFLIFLWWIFITFIINSNISILAETGYPMPQFEIDNINITYKDSTLIKGTFEVSNLNDIYVGNLVYVTKVYRGKLAREWELVNEVVVPFQIYPKEIKVVNFVHKLPLNLVTDYYRITITILNENGLIVGYAVKDVGNIEGTNVFLISQNSEDKFISDGKENSALNYNIVQAGESPQIKINLTNISSQIIKAWPIVKIYAGESEFKSLVISEFKGNVEEFQKNEKKEIIIKLPPQEKAGLYVASVTMMDKDNNPVSGIHEFRYIVKGISAKIVNVDALFNELGSKVKIRVSISGPLDFSKIPNAIVEVNVYEHNTGELIKQEAKVFELGPMIQTIDFDLELNGVMQDLRIETFIKYNSKILDSSIIKIPRVTFVPKLNRPFDVVGTSYEYAVGKLVDAGIISGYPDGTFKPERRITRAEFSKIICYLLNKHQEAEQVKGTSKFKDVDSNYWASGYINVAWKNNLIKGYPGGDFKPNNNVSYAEAITILVRVLGYGKETEEKGKWPYNYISKAEELGVIGGITWVKPSAEATRGDVAKLVWNTYTKILSSN